MRMFRSLLICLAAVCALVSPTSAQITRHFSGLANSVCRIDPASYRSLPSGFERSIASPYTSTKVKGRPHREAADLARCQYISLDPEFDRLLGHAPTLYQVGDLQPQNFAFEGGAHLPGFSGVQCTHAFAHADSLYCAAETDEVVVTADFTSPVGSKIYRLSLATGNLTEVPVHPPLIGANGCCSYKNQARLACESCQSLAAERSVLLQLAVAVFSDPAGDQPSGLVQLDPYTGSWFWLTNNFNGLRQAGCSPHCVQSAVLTQTSPLADMLAWTMWWLSQTAA